MSIDPKMLLSRVKLELTEPKRWCDRTEKFDQIRVYYGMADSVFRTAVLSGGAVKLKDLSRIYPNSASDPNVLYLISSGLPAHAIRIAEIAKKHGAKVVINQNGVAYPACYPDKWEELNATMKALISLADHVFYQSQFCKTAADKFLGSCKGSSEVLYNPVDTSVFVPRADKRMAGGIRLLLAGTHCDEYRVRIAIETVAELKSRCIDVHLTIAGRYAWLADEALALADAKSMASEEGVSGIVDCRAGYTQEEAVSMFQEADILLHTQYNDSCPRLVVEAMACGLPVVYSASGGVPELVGDDAGVGVAAPLDWEKIAPPAPGLLADAVGAVIAKLELYSTAARARAVAQLDVQPWLARHQQVFEELR